MTAIPAKVFAVAVSPLYKMDEVSGNEADECVRDPRAVPLGFQKRVAAKAGVFHKPVTLGHCVDAVA